MTIQRLLSEGYAPVQIKEMLRTTYFRIRRYSTGDPMKLCSFKSMKREPEASQYRDIIVELLAQNFQLKQILEKIVAIGYQGKRTSFEVYCRKLISEFGILYMPKRNPAGVPICLTTTKAPARYVSASEVFQYIWSGKELEASDIGFITSKYPSLLEIIRCVQDFRKVYTEKSSSLMQQFIDTYSSSEIKPIKSFASGLLTDYDAVMNSVTSELSNGFVEGINNKIKVIKRTMYGRAKIDLLRVKVIYARS